MPKILFVILLALLALPGFTQEDNGGGRVIIHDSSPTESVEINPETIQPLTDGELIIQEAEADRLKQIEKIKMVESSSSPIKEAKNPLQQIQELGHEQIDAAALLDDKVIDILQKTMREGSMSKISDEDLKKQIKLKLKDTWPEKIFRRFPKLLSIFSDLVRDPEALPGLLEILRRKDDLKDYGYIWLAIFLVGLYIKHRLVKPTWKFGRRFKWKFVINGVLSVISIGVFFSFFGNDIQPTLNIIGRHLF